MVPPPHNQEDNSAEPVHLGFAEKEEQKEIIKEALKEWLDEKWATVGKWTAKGIAATALSALAYWWLTTYGWHH